MKKFFVFTALLLIMSAIVFAQNAPSTTTALSGGSSAMPGGFSSPQSTATQGRFRSAADNFIMPSNFTGVSFKTFYAMVSYASSNKAQLGFATKIGTSYLGLAYAGNFWAGYTPLSYEEVSQGWNSGDDRTLPKYFFTSKDSPFVSTTPENRIAILLGLPDLNMGVRFTFSSTHEWIYLNKDLFIGTDSFTSYEADRGAITPQIAWAMTKALTDNGIQPSAVLELGFQRNSIKYDEAGTNGINIVRSQNYFEPTLAIGLGGYTLYSNDAGFKLSADLDYVFGMKIYSNEYNYTDSNGDFKTKTINGYYIKSGTDAGTAEYFAHTHSITPSLSGQWSGGPLALRFKLNLGVPIIGEEKTVKTNPNTDGSFDTSVKTSTGSIGFNPDLRLAAQWKVIPNLTLNLGGRINFNAGYLDTATTDGKKKVTVNRSASTTITQFTFGFTFLPTDNLTFEAGSGITGGDKLEPGAVFTLTNLLVGLKF